VTDDELLARRFEADRGHLRAVAYRMLGSLGDAEDAVQEAWLRLQRSNVGGVDNLTGWLTTVVGRVCLDMLRTRRTRREELWDVRLPDPAINWVDEVDPAHEAVLADSVGLALLVVLETLKPAERVAFVLHDLFGVPFDELAPVVGRSPDATKMLASRARRRVRGAVTDPEADPSRRREVVQAFLKASREGDFDALVGLLDPDVLLRADWGAGALAGEAALVRGGAVVARQAMRFAKLIQSTRLVLVNGDLGVLSIRNGRPAAVLSFTIITDVIVAIDVLADPERLVRLG